MYFKPKEVVETYRNGCQAKAHTPILHLMIKSIFAGVMIGMGAAGSSVAAHAITNVGLARLVASVVFPVGLMMVILMGAELFTGDCLMIVGLPEGDITPAELVKTLILVWFGNLFGGVLLSLLIVGSGQLDYSAGLLGAYTIKVALAKAAITPLKAITSGILCNILVCFAVFMTMCAKDVTGKLLSSFFVIMLFVTSGFEHCVANMYYMTAGIFAKMNASYAACAAEAYGITGDQLAALNWKTMMANNLLPVTIGNIIGGACCVGLPLYYINKEYVKQKKAKEVVAKDEYGSDYGYGFTH